jgi:hypothetical protein
MTYTVYRTGQCSYIEPYPLNTLIRCTRDHAAGKQYCEPHLQKMGQKGTALRRRHKDLRVAAAIWDLESEFNEAVTELIAEGEIQL